VANLAEGQETGGTTGLEPGATFFIVDFMVMLGGYRPLSGASSNPFRLKLAMVVEGPWDTSNK